MSPVKVSILIAVRNEEKNLPRLLASILALKYPKESLEILFGNDASTDNTKLILEEFVKHHGYAKLINLSEKMEGETLKGKARVLEQLAHEATGEYFYFTDADITLPPKWIEGISKHFTQNVGVVLGCTSMPANPFWSGIQGLEWIITLYFMHLLSKLKIISTGMGNNMAVSKEAYWAVGGYAKLGFSIVEDYALYKAIIDKGFAFSHSYEPDVMAFTSPPENYLEQRKRWIKGGFENKSKLLFVAFLQILLLPLALYLAFIKPQLAICMLLNIWVLYFLLIAYLERKLKLKGYLKYIIPFSLYIPISAIVQFIAFIWPTKVVWKDRNY